MVMPRIRCTVVEAVCDPEGPIECACPGHEGIAALGGPVHCAACSQVPFAHRAGRFLTISPARGVLPSCAPGREGWIAADFGSPLHDAAGRRLIVQDALRGVPGGICGR